MAETDDEITARLVRYSQTRQPEDLNVLVLHFYPLIGNVVRAMWFPTYVDRDDLISCGVLGLYDALERFDPTMGVRFATFASPRIRGAITDQLRVEDWTSKHARAKVRALNTAQDGLRAELHRDPTVAEIAARLDTDVATVEAMRVIRNRLSTVESLAALTSFYGVDHKMLRLTVEADAGAGDDVAVIADQIARAIAELPELERVVLHLYFFEQLTMAEIGELVGITAARVSALHTRAIGRLQRSIAS